MASLISSLDNMKIGNNKIKAIWNWENTNGVWEKPISTLCEASPVSNAQTCVHIENWATSNLLCTSLCP